MPGTIQVSVLGFMDVPPSGQFSSSALAVEEGPSGVPCLKIAMGKTEYRTEDKGDFSFPVTSLHENLKLTLLDADGNEISRTDVKTMIVVEKRSWDSLFLLDGGGYVHLKLQFILNAEEHKRIREMRDAALKRRHGELPKSDSKNSVAENTTTSSTIIAEEEHLPAQLLEKSQDRRSKMLIASLSEDLQQQLEHHHEQDVTCQPKANEASTRNQAVLKDIHEISVSSKETVGFQLGCSESLVSEEITATSSSSSAKVLEERKVSNSKDSAHEKFRGSKIKKTISAFENISVQEPRSRVGLTGESWMRRVNRGDSLGAPWSKEMNTENITIGGMMPKSFSMGALPQLKSAPFVLTHARVQEEDKPTGLDIGMKSSGNYKQASESKIVQDREESDAGNKNAVSEFVYPVESPSCEQTNDALEAVETKEVVTSHRTTDITKNIDQYSSCEAKASPAVAFQVRKDEAFTEKLGLGSFTDGVSFLDSVTSYGSLDMTASHCFEKECSMHACKDHKLEKINKGNDKMVKNPCAYGEYLGYYLESSDRRQQERTNEIKNGEEAFMQDPMISRKVAAEPAIRQQRSTSSIYQGQTKPSDEAKHWFSSTQEDSYELTACRSSSVKFDGLLSYFDAEQCLLGSHDHSIPRYVCITSGTKQLKDIIGGFIPI